jgi:hypothetical protein
MAVTTLLSIGIPQVMTQNQVFALPARRCLLFAEGTPTIEQSADATNWVALTINTTTNNQAEVGGGWIRCTSGSPDVFLKATA